MAKENVNFQSAVGLEAFGGHKIAEVLVRRGVMTEDGMRLALERMPLNAGRLERYLVESHDVQAAEMTLAVADYLRMPPISLANFTPNPELIAGLPAEILRQHAILPMLKFGSVLTVAMGDPFDIVALDELKQATGLQITPMVAAEKEVQDALAHLMAGSETTAGFTMEDILQSSDDNDVEVGNSTRQEESLEEMLESAEGAPVIRMVNMIMVEALRTRASDIHIEPLEKALRLRYRVDGDLIERPNPPKSFQAAIIRVSRSWPIWTLPNAACRRTAASTCRWGARNSTSASVPSRPCMAKASCCDYCRRTSPSSTWTASDSTPRPRSSSPTSSACPTACSWSSAPPGPARPR